MEWAPELGLCIAAMNQCRGGDSDPAGASHDLDCFRDTTAGRDHIFGDEESLAWRDAEPASKNQDAALFFREYVAFAEGLGQLVPDEKPPERRRYDRVEIRRVQLLGQRGAEARGLVRILEEQRALEKLTAMATGAEDKVPFE